MGKCESCGNMVKNRTGICTRCSLPIRKLHVHSKPKKTRNFYEEHKELIDFLASKTYQYRKKKALGYKIESNSTLVTKEDIIRNIRTIKISGDAISTHAVEVFKNSYLGWKMNVINMGLRSIISSEIYEIEKQAYLLKRQRDMSGVLFKDYDKDEKRIDAAWFEFCSKEKGWVSKDELPNEELERRMKVGDGMWDKAKFIQKMANEDDDGEDLEV